MSGRYTYDLCSSTDGNDILEILESDISPNNISLVYTRRPNPIQSFEYEGKEVKVVVCRDTQNKNQIVGFGALAIRELYINGKPTNVGYLFNLKVGKKYKNKLKINKGYDLLFSHSNEVPLYYTTIVDGNTKAKKLLEKRRSIMPRYTNAGQIITHVLRAKSNISPYDSVLHRCDENTISEVVRFINSQGKNKDFFPRLTWPPKNSLLNNKDFYFIKENDEIIAAGALWDQSSYKQLKVVSYSGAIKMFYWLRKPLSWLNIFHFVKTGENIKYKTMSYWAVKDNNKTYFDLFVSQVRKELGKEEYLFVGLHETDPNNKTASRLSRFKYKSWLYLVSKSEHGNSYTVKTPFIEIGML
jgi:hypothetical protein